MFELHLRVGVPAILLAIPGTAFAQSASAGATPSTATSESQTSAGDEIIVTAQRRQQRLAEVPIGITALSGKDVLASGVPDTRGLAQVTPGLTAVNNGFNFSPAIRGITTSLGTTATESNVALYVDNVFMPVQAINSFRLPDLESVQVLKGPQGTLFGRNATGGAILIQTRDPQFDPTADVSARYGFDKNSKEVNAFLSGGLGEKAAFSVSGYYYKDDGFIRNVNPAWTGSKLGDLESHIVRGKLLLRPTDDLEVLLEADTGRQDSTVEFAVAPLGSLSTAINPGVVLPNPRKYETSQSFSPNIVGRSDGGYARIKWSPGSTEITSTTAYRSNKLNTLLDLDRSNLRLTRLVFNEDVDVLTQEFLLSTKLFNSVDFVAGAFYIDKDAGTPASNVFSDSTNALISGTQAKVRVKAGAVFADATWKVSSRVRLLGGIRFNHESKKADITVTTPAAGSASNQADKSWNNVSFRAVAQYFFNPDLNLYGSLSTGFKSGEFNELSLALPAAKPEKATAYEVGLRGVLGSANFYLAAFHYDYKDIQVAASNLAGTTATLTLTNAAQAKITGLEGELSGNLIPHLNVRVGASWMPKADYTAFPGAQIYLPAANGLGLRSAFADISGSRVLRAPKFTGNVGAAYDFEIGGGQARVSANYAYNSGFFWTAGETIKQSGYSIVNLNASWTEPSRRFTFTLFSQNLFDELYYVNVQQNAAGNLASYGTPREIGLSVAAHF